MASKARELANSHSNSQVGLTDRGTQHSAIWNGGRPIKE